MTEHPITPPPELVEEWCAEFFGYISDLNQSERYIATKAARWGADAELEACCQWLEEVCTANFAADLYRSRRPKGLTLKEKALEALALLDKESKLPFVKNCETVHAIRRALESLPD